MLFNRALPRKIKHKMNVLDYSKDKDIIEYKVVQKVKKTGETDTDFILENEVVVASRVNRQAHFNEIAKDHDIYAIIAKVQDTGDLSLLNQGPEGVYIDVSKLPQNGQELNDRLQNAAKVWEALPDDLKGNMSLGAFVDAMTDEKIMEYVKSKSSKKVDENGVVIKEENK